MEPKAVSLIISVYGRIVRLAVHAQAQFFAYLKEGHFFGSDGNQRAAFRIAPLTRAPVFDDEAPKAANFDAVSRSERVDHRIEYGIYNDLRIAPRKMGKSFVDLID
jgi:hypothetical protein